ncbi:MAG: hypothetical protein HY648_06120, partial [Acidobacteria bacterium]|nr:hypothetical protein [Acidobacteriota bacterium]
MTQPKNRLIWAIVFCVTLIGGEKAHAQAVCTAGATPTLLRAQGMTEVVGNIVLSNCSGNITTGGASLSVALFPNNLAITNALDAGFAPTAVVTSAAAGAIGTQVIPGSVSGNVVSFGLPATTFGQLSSIKIGGISTVAGSVGIRVSAN